MRYGKDNTPVTGCTISKEVHGGENSIIYFSLARNTDISAEIFPNHKLHGRILTPDGLRVVCAGLDNDSEKIGKHMLEMLAKFRNEGLFDVVVEDE